MSTPPLSIIRRRGGPRPGPRPHKALAQRTPVQGKLGFRIAYDVALLLDVLLRRSYPSCSTPTRPNPDALLGFLITEAAARNGSCGASGHGLTYAPGQTLRFENTSLAPVTIAQLAVSPGASVEVTLNRSWHEAEGAGCGGPWGFAGYTTSLLLSLGTIEPSEEGERYEP